MSTVAELPAASAKDAWPETDPSLLEEGRPSLPDFPLQRPPPVALEGQAGADWRSACGNCGNPCRLAPYLFSAARQPELIPHRVDLVDHRLIHADFASPLTIGLAGELVGGVEADLRAEARDRAREVEIVDRRFLDHGDV